MRGRASFVLNVCLTELCLSLRYDFHKIASSDDSNAFGGTVRMDVEDGLTVEQKNAGYVLPCVSRATGTVVLSA